MKRLGWIDSSRGLAVVLAMLSHAIIQFCSGFWENLGLSGEVWLLTRTATPTFMILFGIMIELVYLRPLRSGAPYSGVQQRLLARMLTCYLLFAAITLAAVSTGKLLPHEGMKAILYMGDGRFGVILKIYAALFLLIVLLLPFAVRHGSTFFIALAGAGWLLKFALALLPVPHWHILQFLTGHTKGFGPAILPGLSFVAFGIMVGEALSGHRRRTAAMLTTAAASALLVLGVSEVGAEDFARGIIDVFRWQNSPYYFAFGIVACALSLVWFAAIWTLFPEPTKGLTLSRLGRETLFVYGFGNILINLLPVYGGKSLIGLLFVPVFLVILIILTVQRDKLFELLDTLTMGLATLFLRHYRVLCAQAVEVMSAHLPGTRKMPFQR